MTDRKGFGVGEDRKYREELVALFDFTPNYQEPEAIKMIEMKKNDRILLIEKDENGWWLGKIGNKTGYFPSNFVATKRAAGNTRSQEDGEEKTSGTERITGYSYDMNTDKNQMETSKKITIGFKYYLIKIQKFLLKNNVLVLQRGRSLKGFLEWKVT